MQTYPAPPPNPLFGIITWGFVFLVIYGFVRLSSEGEARFSASKKTISLGLVGLVIITLLESLNLWIWFLQVEPVNYFVIVIGSMMIGLLFIIIPMIDLAVQWYILRS